MRTLLFLLAFGFSLFLNANTEQQRISSHLKLVESLLRQMPRPEMTTEQLQTRMKLLDGLREYWHNGSFPRNLVVPNSRNPIFIDDRGVPCAVGFLIQFSGHKELANKLAKNFNTYYLEEMEDAELKQWVENSGFTLDELKLIQPAYSYQPQYQDSFVESAYLGDFEAIKSQIEQLGSISQERLNEALRAVVLVADQKPPPKKNLRAREMMIYYEPTPFKGRAMEVLEMLLKKGADPNDQSNQRRSIFSITKLHKVKLKLAKFGGKLSFNDQLVLAIDAGDLARFTGVLKTAKPQEIKPGIGVDVPTYIIDQFIKERIPKNHSTNFDIKLVPYQKMTSPFFKMFEALIESKLYSNPFVDSKEGKISFYPKLVGHRFWDLIEFLIDQGQFPLASENNIGIVQFWIDLKFSEDMKDNQLFFYTFWKNNVDFFTPDRMKKFEKLVLSQPAPDEYQIQNFFVGRYSNNELMKKSIQFLIDLKWPIPKKVMTWYIDAKRSALGGPSGAFKVTPSDLELLNILAQYSQPIDSYLFATVLKSLDPKLIEFALNHGANPNETPYWSECPAIGIAVELGDLQLVKKFIERKVNLQVSWMTHKKNCVESKDYSPSKFPGMQKKLLELKMSDEIRKAIEKG